MRSGHAVEAYSGMTLGQVSNKLSKIGSPRSLWGLRIASRYLNEKGEKRTTTKYHFHKGQHESTHGESLIEPA